MKKKYVKITACTMAVALAFTGVGFDVNANGNSDSVLPSSGIDFFIMGEDNSTSLSSMQEESNKETENSEETEGATIGTVQVGQFAEMAST